MFNLIVAVISIALIAAMAAASIFYGGSAFGSGTAQAQASTLVNNGQQISGAQQLYMIDNSGNRNSVNDMTGTAPDGLQTDGYLQAVPTPPANSTGANATDLGTWLVSDDGTYAFIDLNTAPAGANISPAETVCSEVVDQGGQVVDSITLLTDGSSPNPLTGSSQFGCVTAATAVDFTDTVGDMNSEVSFFVFKL
jgi:hypothetical protein